MNSEEFDQLSDELMAKFNKWKETSENSSLDKLLEDYREWEKEAKRINEIENTDRLNPDNGILARIGVTSAVDVFTGTVASRLINVLVKELNESRMSNRAMIEIVKELVNKSKEKPAMMEILKEIGNKSKEKPVKKIATKTRKKRTEQYIKSYRH